MPELIHQPIETIAAKILSIRGQKVMIDADLADLYGVKTKALNQAVKRNAARFPEDFMFRLTSDEKQEVVTKCDHLHNLKFSKTLPFAFTEHGTIQAANVLNSSQAAEISVYVVRAFVQLRELLASNKELAKRLDELEQRIERKLDTHDQAITGLINTLRQMMSPEETKKRLMNEVNQLHSMNIYWYVGPKDLLDLIHTDVNRVAVINEESVRSWIHQTDQKLDYDNSVTATYIIDTNKVMWICDRHMEHVVCAIGGPVLSAGEATFKISTKSVEISYITNQSTGFCPKPSSWKVVNVALKNTGINYPQQFSTNFIFRLCLNCKTINIVKEKDYVCAVCNHDLEKQWNLNATSAYGKKT